MLLNVYDEIVLHKAELQVSREWTVQSLGYGHKGCPPTPPLQVSTTPIISAKHVLSRIFGILVEIMQVFADDQTSPCCAVLTRPLEDPAAHLFAVHHSGLGLFTHQLSAMHFFCYFQPSATACHRPS